MTSSRPTIAILGAGAAGTLAALHLTRTAARRSTSLQIVVLDPVSRLGTGTAFGTLDESHLLNVPASGMSALPEDPAHFVSWLSRHQPDLADPYSFVPRRVYARYLEDTLNAARAEAADVVSLELVLREAISVDRESDQVVLGLDDGSRLRADAAVLATGWNSPGTSWAPAALKASPFFVPDPWAPGALDVVARDGVGPSEVLLVGTGLTAVDVALLLTRKSPTDRVLHAISRSGELPHRHAERMTVPVIPEVTDWGTELDGLREQTMKHLREVAKASGDWRPAVDGLRFQLSALWGRLDDEGRCRFLAEDAGRWNRLRHRVAPQSAAAIDVLVELGALEVSAATVVGVEALPSGGLRTHLTDGSVRDVGWVVNCTGPETDIRDSASPIIDDLLRPRAGGGAWAIASTAGLGVQTDEGRLIDQSGRPGAPLWTLGALRRGDLWESTAVPEIRTQARALAAAVLDEVAPQPRRLADGRIVGGRHPIARPRDLLGLPLSTTAEAAMAYNAGLERVLRVQGGAEELFAEASELDPGFALAHAALAMLGHEAGASVDVPTALAAAQQAVADRGDEREESLIRTIVTRVHATASEGAQSLLAHVASHPRDVLAVSAAVPTIAFSGVTDIRREAWELVEGLGPAYGDHWWYLSLLAFTRQDQDRFEEANFLAENALACEPASGHAAHALAHVLYETGRHEVGRSWLDHWINANGRSATHRAHFVWHAALHDLSLGDTEAVRQRYYAQLAPPTVTGVRALIDSAALLWRWQMVTAPAWGLADGPVPPVEPVLEAVGSTILDDPQTPFVALHAAIGLAAAKRTDELRSLADRCRRSTDPAMASVVAAVSEGLLLVDAEQYGEAADLFEQVLPLLERIGGSSAQREVVEETQLFCLLSAGREHDLHDALDRRVQRRGSPLDQGRLTALSGSSASAAGGSTGSASGLHRLGVRA